MRPHSDRNLHDLKAVFRGGVDPDFQPDKRPDLFVEYINGILALFGVADALEPVGNHLVAGGFPAQLLRFGAEFHQLQPGFYVAGDAGDVMDGGQAQGFQFVLGALLQQDLLQVRRDPVPDVLVDHVGGGIEAVQPAVHIVGHFVPPLGKAGVGAGYAGVQDAALQRGVHFGESHRLGFGAHIVNPVGKLGAVAAGLEALEIVRVFQPVLAEKELVIAGDPVAEQHLSAGFVLNHLSDVVENVG